MRLVPVFKDKIRRHNENISEMRQMTAADYEDILQVRSIQISFYQCAYLFQCTLPIFDGLLPEEHDKKVMKMLHLLGLTYTLSKLHMHTDETACALLDSIQRFGDAARDFAKVTCVEHQRLLTEQEVMDVRRARLEKSDVVLRKSVTKKWLA